jgi:hypothetical protein
MFARNKDPFRGSDDRFMDDMEMDDDKDTATVTGRKKMGTRGKISTLSARGRKSSSMPSRSRKKK